MGRPKQLSDEAILKVAKECFIKQGPSVSTAVIAEKAGVSQAALFKRFGTKKALTLKALLPHNRPPWADRIEKGPDPINSDLRAQLREVVELLWTFIQDTMPCLTALKASGVPVESFAKTARIPPPVHGQRALAKWFRIAEKQGRARVPNPDHLAFILAGSLHGRSFFKHALDQRFAKKEDQAYLETVTDLLWNAIVPKEP
jgi:AcrR family transcriptional regulator